MAEALAARRYNEFSFSQAAELRPHQPGNDRPGSQAYGQHDHGYRRLPNDHQDDHQQKRRYGLEDLGDANQHIIDPAPEVSRNTAYQHTDEQTDARGHGRTEQRRVW